MVQVSDEHVTDRDRDPKHVAFPRLSGAQLHRLESFATCRKLDDGEVIFKPGEPVDRFYIVMSGAIRISEASSGSDREIVRHEPGEFTGEVSMVTGEPSPVWGRAAGETKVLQLGVDCLRKLIAEQAEVGETVLKAFLMRRSLLKEHGYEAVRLIGSGWSPATHQLKAFLARQQVLFTFLDLEKDAGVDRLLASFGLGPADTPVVICADQTLLRNPTTAEVAKCLGISGQPKQAVYDLVVIGAGPAGLASAVYGASEGLSTLVLEADAPGGQASASSKIENYLGFPTGLSGQELAERATLQARKFGAALSSPSAGAGLVCDGQYKRITIGDDGETVAARSVVIATGAEYRKLTAADMEQFEGAGIYYAATQTEAQVCADAEVIVVGGGNSAGQAAVFMANHAKRVTVMIRRDSLAATMSKYLIDRIERAENIELLTGREITACHGNGRLQAVRVRDNGSGDEAEMDAAGLFIMIGAQPRTDWLNGCVLLDGKGFVLTGESAERHPGFAGRRKDYVPRHPYLLETSSPGVFAVGDVRAGSIKRVASAVGEGSMAIAFVHQHLDGGWRMADGGWRMADGWWRLVF